MFRQDVFLLRYCRFSQSVILRYFSVWPLDYLFVSEPSDDNISGLVCFQCKTTGIVSNALIV